MTIAKFATIIGSVVGGVAIIHLTILAIVLISAKG